MSDLRKHLDAAKGEYRSTRYPGDLAAQVLKRPQGSRNGRWVVAAMFAAAAVLFVMLWMNVPQKRESTGERPIASDMQEIETGDSEEETVEFESFAFADMPSLSLPAIPDEMEFTPAAPEFHAQTPGFSIAVPTFSLLGDDAADEEQSNQEEKV